MPDNSLGSFLLVLHTHIPYVISHGRSPHGTDWLAEAAAECYIPLLDTLYTLAEDGYSPKVTIGLTPVLAEQLEDPAFRYELSSYLHMKLDALERDENLFRSQGRDDLAYLAGYWRSYFDKAFRNYRRKYKRSIVGAFRELQDAGHIEVITSGATHGYFPLLSQDTSIQAQVKQGVETYRKHFGRDPRGIWLPECAYRPRYTWAYPVTPDGQKPTPYLRKGVEEFLSENGLKYFFVEAHLILGGATGAAGTGGGVYADRFDPLSKLWTQFQKHYLPEYTERTERKPYYVQSYGEGDPVAVFARDQQTGSQVWSSVNGYPGDEWYLEFHKMQERSNAKYWRVTGVDDFGLKQEYDPEKAAERTRNHAEHFVGLVKDVLREYKEKSGTKGIVCAPFDTELYGHWWAEGPQWLYHMLKRMGNDPEIETSTCGEYLEKNPPTNTISLPEGSWGEGGFHWIWLNQETDWTWKMIYQAEAEMKELTARLDNNPAAERVLKQAARELFVMQASDWQFNISTQNSIDYAETRLNYHHRCFKRLAEIAKKVLDGQQMTGEEDDFVDYCEDREPLFDNVDPKWFAGLEKPAQ